MSESELHVGASGADRARGRFFATCRQGHRGCAARRAAGAAHPAHQGRPRRRALWWALEDAMRACFESRIALRVLWRRGTFERAMPRRSTRACAPIELSDVLDPERSLSVTATVKNGALTHSGFVRKRPRTPWSTPQRDRYGARSNVERDDPDVRVVVHIVKRPGRAVVDLAGESLHRPRLPHRIARGPDQGDAGGRDAATRGLGSQAPLIDPMWGSGTIAIEAAHVVAEHGAGAVAQAATAFSAGCCTTPVQGRA